jgi:hypothetical protein
MMMPIVVQLDDDDCDGRVTSRDIPDILFTTFSAATGGYTQAGVLRAISIVEGAVVEKWSLPNVVSAAAELAGGNLDGEEGSEVVACGKDGKVRAYRGDGTLLWVTEQVHSCRMPALADLEGDGRVEVVVDGAILDGRNGALLTILPAGNPVVSDINGDGVLEVVTSQRAYAPDGTVVANTGVSGSWPAVGDFDLDGVPEVVAVNFLNHTVSLWRYHPEREGNFVMVRSAVDINGALSPDLCPEGSSGSTRGGGPPTVADFNGDGFPDVALAGGVGYVVLDGTKLMDPNVAGPDTVLWISQTHDCSSAATGSSVFDFNGDGRAEVVYSDEYYLRIYDGLLGTVLWSTCNTTGTLLEYPVIADVDNDGQADIVVASNAYAYTCEGTKQSGIRVFGSDNGSWVQTRRVWNQHSYHVTNIAEDGTIPRAEPPNWRQPGLNNFRQNKQPLGEFSAPDLVVELGLVCPGPTGLVARVRNLGQAAAPAGVVVGFYDGATRIGQAVTTRALYAVESQDVSLPVDLRLVGPLTAVVDDGGPEHPWRECRTDNNRSAPISPSCTVE